MPNFIFYVNPDVTLMCRPPSASGLFSLETAASLTGVHPEMLKYYLLAGLLSFERTALSDEPVFNTEALAEIRRIDAYRQDGNIPLKALPLVCSLQVEIDRLNREIRRLQAR